MVQKLSQAGLQALYKQECQSTKEALQKVPKTLQLLIVDIINLKLHVFSII